MHHFITVFIVCVSLLIFSNSFTTASNLARKDKPYGFEWNATTGSFQHKNVELPVDSPSLQPDFMTSPPRGKFRSHSNPAAKQDMVVLNILQDMSKGFYLDAYAHDPETDSNSFVLENFNSWSGVCIEPDPTLYTRLLAQRKCKVYTDPVATSHGTLRTSSSISAIAGSSNSMSITLSSPTTTLQTILSHAKAPSIIHYASFNMNGAEHHVLHHFPFEQYTFWLITVAKPRPKLHNLLVRRGYIFVYTLNAETGDSLYVHHSLPNLLSVMKQYHWQSTDPTKPPSWHNNVHLYLLEPPWMGYYVPPSILFAPLMPPDEP